MKRNESKAKSKTPKLENEKINEMKTKTMNERTNDLVMFGKAVFEDPRQYINDELEY